MNTIRAKVSLLLLAWLAGSSSFGAAAVPAAAALSASAAADAWHTRRAPYFQRTWGVDVVGVKPVSSGYMLAFRYRVLDPKKAKALNDPSANAYVIDEASGARLAVPNMENIGKLRQMTAPEKGRSYFIIFGNPGRLVKPGNRVDVVIGDFRIDGLIVD